MIAVLAMSLKLEVSLMRYGGVATAEGSGSSFFFQAEDGIRDYKVTGVQTCALPILMWSWKPAPQKSCWLTWKQRTCSRAVCMKQSASMTGRSRSFRVLFRSANITWFRQRVVV